MWESFAEEIEASTRRGIIKEAVDQEFVSKLKPGDVLVLNRGSSSATEGKGRLKAKLQRLTSAAMKVQLGVFGHAGIYAGDGKVIDAHPSYGVKEQAIEKMTEGVGVIAMRPNLPEKDRLKAVERAKNKIGDVDYSTREALRAWAGIHFKMPVRDRRKRMTAVMCSGLVNDSYLGKAAPKHPDVTVPPDLARSRNMTPIAVFDPGDFQSGAIAALEDEISSITGRIRWKSKTAAMAGVPVYKEIGGPLSDPVMLKADVPVESIKGTTPGTFQTSLRRAIRKSQGIILGFPNVALPAENLPKPLEDLGFKPTRTAIPLPGEAAGATSWRAGRLHVHKIGDIVLAHEDAHVPKGLSKIVHTVTEGVPALIKRTIRGEADPVVLRGIEQRLGSLRGGKEALQYIVGRYVKPSDAASLEREAGRQYDRAMRGVVGSSEQRAAMRQYESFRRAMNKTIRITGRRTLYGAGGVIGAAGLAAYTAKKLHDRGGAGKAVTDAMDK